MKPKLRRIITTRRVGSVPRKDIRAAIKAVMAERTPEMQALARGECIPAGPYGRELPIPDDDADDATLTAYFDEVRKLLKNSHKPA